MIAPRYLPASYPILAPIYLWVKVPEIIRYRLPTLASASTCGGMINTDFNLHKLYLCVYSYKPGFKVKWAVAFY